MYLHLGWRVLMLVDKLISYESNFYQAPLTSQPGMKFHSLIVPKYIFELKHGVVVVASLCCNQAAEKLMRTKPLHNTKWDP
jgi:hypothetical protein